MIKLKEFIKGIILENNTVEPTVDKEGSLYVFGGKLKSYLNSALRVFVTEDGTHTLTNKSIDADNNTITNISNDAIKASASILESKLALDYGTNDLHVEIGNTNTNVSNHINDTNNPHTVTKSQVLAGNVDNSDISPTAGIIESKLALDHSTNSLNTDISNHKSNTNNPHSVTKAQVLSGDLISNDDVASNALIIESKLSLDYSTSSLNNAVNNISNSNIVSNADIDESKLSLDYSTSSLKNDVDNIPVSKGTQLLSNNVTTFTDITGLSLPSGVLRGGRIDITVQIMADTNLYEVFSLFAIRRDSDWVFSTNTAGDNSGVSFFITASGQLQYKSDNYSGFTSGKFSWVKTDITNP